MLLSQYEQSMKQKNFFLLPNSIFELKLNQYEFYIYAYLIRTERTEFVTKDGIKRNDCLRYHILPMQHTLDRHNERRLAELELTTARLSAKAKAEKLGIEFIPAGDGQSA